MEGNIGLPQLIGVLRDFFARIGISKLRQLAENGRNMSLAGFKPAYNPYTEPSMEVFGWEPSFSGLAADA